MKKRFYTLCLTPDKVDLLKDPGMIPYYLGKMGYESHFVSFIEPRIEDPFQKQVGGDMTLHYLGKQKLPKHPQLMMCCRKAFRYIFTHRKGIDILNLYYLKHSILYGLFYKMVRPKGCLYIKVDMNVRAFEREATQPLHFVRRFVYQLYLRYVVDKVTIESTSGYKAFQEQFALPPNKVLYLPNGIDDTYLDEVPPIPFEQKENLIITVARIGAPEKNHEMLIEACRYVHWLGNWQLHLVGPVDEAFKERTLAAIKGMPWEDRIQFIGPIYDKKALFEYYSKSKIFCMTSRYESFGFVCIEAQAYGNILLSTPIAASPDFIQNDQMGHTICSAIELANAINHLIEHPETMESAYSCIVRHAQQYRWSTVCARLSDFLQS